MLPLTAVDYLLINAFYARQNARTPVVVGVVCVLLYLAVAVTVLSGLDYFFGLRRRMQQAQAGDAPALIRIETRAGHGAGKPTAKIIEDVTDEWAFLVKNLGMKPGDLEIAAP